MCIVLCCINRSDEYPFILISNRDEFFIRKTLKLCLTDSVIAPHDMARTDGGTWIGLNVQNGSVCCLVNYREPFEKLSKLSRGNLPLRYLNGSMEEFLQYYEHNAQDIGGFSLVYGNIKHHDEDVNVVSNRSINKKFGKGSIFGLSNSKINEPWPKVLKGEKLLDELMTQNIKDKDILIQELFKVLSYQDVPVETMDDLPNSIFIPPVKTEKKDDEFYGNYYGTRTQTIIMVDKLGNASYLEKTLYDDDSLQRKNQLEKFEFNLHHDKI